jgi:hypothetical protein
VKINVLFGRCQIWSEIMQSFFLNRLKTIASAMLLAALGACGGGGGGGGTSTTPGAVPSDPGLAVTGAVVKGPVSAATVCVYSVVSGVKGPKINVVSRSGSNAQISNGCWITGADGSYNFALPAGSSGDYLVEATGGSYCSNESEVSGSSCASGGSLQNLGSTVLTAIVNLTPGGSAAQVYLTPFSTAAVSSLPGAYNFTSFQSRFTVLSGQLGLSGLLPSSPPTTTPSIAVLASASQYISQGGSLGQVIQSLSQGTTSYPSVTSTGTSTGTQTSSSFAPLGVASFANYSTATTASFVAGVVGSHDVAIYRAPASNPEWIGPGRVTVGFVNGITSVQLAIADGTVISSWSQDTILASIITTGRLFGNGGGLSPVATYLITDFTAAGQITGFSGGQFQVAFRNNILAYGPTPPAALAELAGTYTGPQQAATCGTPRVTLTFTASTISMSGSHSLACTTATYNATWDGNDDYIAPRQNGEIVINIDENKGGGSGPPGGFSVITTGQTTSSMVVNAIVFGAGFDGNVQSNNLVKLGAVATRAQLTNNRLRIVSPVYPVVIALGSGSSIPAPFSNAGNDQISFNNNGQLLYKGTTFDYASAVDTPNTTDQKTFTYNRLDAGPISSSISFTIRTDMSFVSGTWGRGSVSSNASGTLTSPPP